MSQTIAQELSQLVARVGHEQEMLKGVYEFFEQISHVPLSCCSEYKITSEMAMFLSPYLKDYPRAIVLHVLDGYKLDRNKLPPYFINLLQASVSEEKQRRIALTIDIPAIRSKLEQEVLSGHYRSGHLLTLSVEKLGESTDIKFLKSQLNDQGINVREIRTEGVVWVALEQFIILLVCR